MKKLNLLFLIVAVFAAASCSKTPDTLLLDGGAVNVINAVVGGTTITLTTNASISSGSNTTISSNNYGIIPIVSGQTAVNIGVPAVAATNTAPAIPAFTYYNQTITVNNADNYSLFLTGASPSAIDNVLIKESYTHTYADSVCGVRFINLATGSNPISVNVKGNANGSEVASLAYKAYSNFLQYPAKRVNPSYIFEFRDATTGNLITSYTLTTPYFHNVTLCLRGSPASGVILDNDF
jgi:hypothetical protein